jgi:hypothetical protein
VQFTLTDPKCDGFSAGSSTTETQSVFPVTNGNIAISLARGDQIKGRFTSPTAASGTIDLTVDPGIGGTPCDLGTWNWSAKAD